MNASPRVFSTVLKAVKPSGRLSHPFFNPQRGPVHLKFLAEHFGRTARTYVPLMITFFSWPFVAKYIIENTNGV